MQDPSTLLKQLSLDALLLLGRAHTALERDALPAAPEGFVERSKTSVAHAAIRMVPPAIPSS
jgi:hypothetical protein